MNGKIIFGTVLIFFGVLFLLGQFFMLPIGTVWSYWPLILVGMGTYQLYKNHNSLRSGMMLVMIGTLFQLSVLDIIDSFWGAFWPMLIIYFGLSMILQSKKNKFIEPDIINEIHFESIFSGRKSKVTSNNFTGGVVTTTFGGVEIDLRNSVISPGGAILELNCWFAGIEIFVPEDCIVIVEGSPVFGGIENKSYNKNNSNLLRPTLILKCSVGFGGIEIRNEA